MLNKKIINLIKVPTSSTVTALRTPPALSKAQGKFRSPAPRADFSMMNTAPTEPSRGPADTSSGGLADEDEASRLMLSLANSSMLRPAGSSRWDQLTHTRARSRAAYIRPSARAAGQLADTPRPAHWAKVRRVEGGRGGGGAAFRCGSDIWPRTLWDFLHGICRHSCE